APPSVGPPRRARIRFCRISSSPRQEAHRPRTPVPYLCIKICEWSARTPTHGEQILEEDSAPASSLNRLRADVLQYLFAEHIGIAFNSLGKGNDLVGDGLLDNVGAIAGSQSHASHLESDAHDARRLRVKTLALQKRSDRMCPQEILPPEK